MSDIRSTLRTYQCGEAVSGEIAFWGRLEGDPGGHIGARLGPFGALMPSYDTTPHRHTTNV
eukprot:1627886-Pyramimonas_sp.AAC.1